MTYIRTFELLLQKLDQMRWTRIFIKKFEFEVLNVNSENLLVLRFGEKEEKTVGEKYKTFPLR
jgi:hypothetical protein